MADDDSSGNSSSSTSSFGVSLVFNIVVFFIFVTIFLFLRPRIKTVYQPRAVIATVPDNERPPPLAPGIFGWLFDLVSRSESSVLRDAGIDGYFFLRYLRLITILCLSAFLILFPILFAVNGTGGNHKKGMDILSFTNVADKNRYFATIFLSWVYYGFVLFNIYRELTYYVHIRQAVLTSPSHSELPSSRTVLFNTVPKEYLNEASFRSIFPGVRHVWINRNIKELAKKVEEREKAAAKIEAAEVKILKQAVKARLKSEKKGQNLIEGDDITKYIKKMPTNRLKPVIGKKVETIDYYKKEISRLNGEIKTLQSEYKDAKTVNSAFVMFETQEHAEAAYQTLAHHDPFNMAPRSIGIHPNDIIWSNMRLLWWERLVKNYACIALIIVTIIFWSIPVAFVGFLSNINYLIKTLPWLGFINNLPKVLLGLITSLLPTILLAVLMMLLPIYIRLLAKTTGITSKVNVEYWTQNAYFGFQVVQVFFVTTFTSGAASAIETIISDPGQALTMLRSQLPTASNFYISYFMLYGLTGGASLILGVVALALFYVLGAVLDGTPRKKWNRYNIIGAPGWGTVFPVFSNLFVICMSYALIAPLVLGFGALTFSILYVVYKYNLIYKTRPSDGRGIFYPRALYQIFVGLYIGQLCLVALFVFAKNWACIVLQVVMLVFTIFFQISIQNAFAPLLFNLPTSLTHKASTKGSQKEPLLDEESKNPFDGVGSSTSPTAVEVDDTEKYSGSEVTTPVKGGFFQRYFKPHLFLTPEVLQREMLSSSYMQPPVPLTPEQEALSYAPPAVSASNPIVWIPRDPWGLSDIQVAELRESGVNAYNEGAFFDINEKRKFKYGFGEIGQIPIWAASPQY